jgi:hypothetical protein
MLRSGAVSEQPMTEEEFWAIMTAPIEHKPIFYRLYYQDDSRPICYSMEDFPHNYIEVTPEEYRLGSMNIRIVNEKIVHINPASYVKKLVPGLSGTACDPGDICIVVAEDRSHIKWSIKSNETN